MRPKEDIEIKVSRFYGKVSHPVLTDIEMKIEGVKTYDIYPSKLGDLFAGTELRVLGRYEGDGDGVQSATVAYGVGNAYLYGGDGKRAFETFERILDGESWAAFGFIAAEAEVAACRGKNRR